MNSAITKIHPFKHFIPLFPLFQFVAFFSLGMVVLSTLTFIISTMEELQALENSESEYTALVIVLDYIDTFVIIFFTIEYAVR